MSDYLDTCKKVFVQYKLLGEKAMEQLNESQLNWAPSPESNSIVLIVKHLHGNMISRWTDFLITDGEKEWRNRDAEFESDKNLSISEVNKMWNECWALFFRTLDSLVEDDLKKRLKSGLRNIVFWKLCNARQPTTVTILDRLYISLRLVKTKIGCPYQYQKINRKSLTKSYLGGENLRHES